MNGLSLNNGAFIESGFKGWHPGRSSMWGRVKHDIWRKKWPQNIANNRWHGRQDFRNLIEDVSLRWNPLISSGLQINTRGGFRTLRRRGYQRWIRCKPYYLVLLILVKRYEFKDNLVRKWLCVGAGGGGGGNAPTIEYPWYPKAFVSIISALKLVLRRRRPENN